jgi:hypothetical protein
LRLQAATFQAYAIGMDATAGHALLPGGLIRTARLNIE